MIGLLFERSKRLVRERDGWKAIASNAKSELEQSRHDWAVLYKKLGIVRANLSATRRALSGLVGTVNEMHAVAHDGPEVCPICTSLERGQEILKISDGDSQRHSTGPRIVCLCGSTRFGDAFAKANLDETLAGRIVLSIGCNMRSDAELFALLADAERAEIKTKLDELHRRKIDLADEILVLNVGGYVGESTRGEIEYARAEGKPIRWLEQDKPI